MKTQKGFLPFQSNSTTGILNISDFKTPACNFEAIWHISDVCTLTIQKSWKIRQSSCKRLGDFWMTSCSREVESLILLRIVGIPLTVTNFSEQRDGHLALQSFTVATLRRLALQSSFEQCHLLEFLSVVSLQFSSLHFLLCCTFIISNIMYLLLFFFNKVLASCHFCLLKIELLAVIRVIASLLTRH